MHRLVVSELQKFRDEAAAQGNSALYLQRLGPLHERWHNASASRRTVGFLLFHWHVVQHFQALHLDRLMGVKPYSLQQVGPQGELADADWETIMGSLAPTQDLNDLGRFSVRLESWHNDAHMLIEDQTGAPMMNPRINIFYTPFWNLHAFINNRFSEELLRYARVQHPNLRQAAAVVDHIEVEHHAAVDAI